MKTNWNGVWVATVTPLKDDIVDTTVLLSQIRRLLENKVSGLCPAGTTGEGSGLSDEEFALVLKTVLEIAKGKIPVVPGTGSNDTKKTIARTKLAKELGAQGALIVTPYYVKPTPDGLVRHYTEIANAVDLPIMLYNVPGRTGVNILPETVERIVSSANVAGIKDCSPLPQVAEVIRRLGEKIAVFSGEDPTYLPFLALGGKGIVSVAANLVPKEWVNIFNLFSAGNLTAAQEEFLRHLPFVEALFVESNPIPAKTALEWMGFGKAEFRSPLAPMTSKGAEVLKREMKALRLVR